MDQQSNLLIHIMFTEGYHMKITSVGFGFCALGVQLYLVNFLAAVFHVMEVNRWPTEEGRISVAYDWVGREPAKIGFGLFVLGLILMIGSCRKSRRCENRNIAYGTMKKSGN
ncbi:MAG: hypothetical protein JJU29_08150 [Verrucomicrobia bacterium]|nr:hypothetical protein [Verrucomicrobiota bacterium]MCH8512083.1 hypothetical protein [Kiritimatiellia bacterium]